MRRLNREKLVFLGSALGLCMACAYALVGRPAFEGHGEHRVICQVPGSVRVSLPNDEGPPDLAGRNPFAAWRERREKRGTLADDKRGGAKEKTGRDEKGRIPDQKQLDELINRLKDKQGTKAKQRVPEVYEVPADFIGVHRPSGGRWRVVLKAKQDGENRGLDAGDVWPNLNLRIIRITSHSVLLENKRGKRFLMRDLYGRRAASRDSARAGSGD